MLGRIAASIQLVGEIIRVVTGGAGGESWVDDIRERGGRQFGVIAGERDARGSLGPSRAYGVSFLIGSYDVRRANVHRPSDMQATLGVDTQCGSKRIVSQAVRRAPLTSRHRGLYADGGFRRA